jgi:hypothetical protein
MLAQANLSGATHSLSFPFQFVCSCPEQPRLDVTAKTMLTLTLLIQYVYAHAHTFAQPNTGNSLTRTEK